jgi:hypothetical protein
LGSGNDFAIVAKSSSRNPLIYLNNTTGDMVGKAYEEAGMIKHGDRDRTERIVTSLTSGFAHNHGFRRFGAASS